MTNPIRSVDGRVCKCPSTYEWTQEDLSNSEAGRTEDGLMHKNFIRSVNGAIGVINKIPGVSISKIEVLSIPRFKDGGFPDGEDGLFYANHNELVGKFSNGKTAVENNDQIVGGISNGVYSANQEQNRILLQILKEVRDSNSGSTRCDVHIGTIVKAAQRYNRRSGMTIMPLGV